LSGVGWADKTVTNISKMIINRQYSSDRWEQYWNNKLGIKDYLDIDLLSVNLAPCKHL